MPAHPWTLIEAGKYQEAVEEMTKTLSPPSRKTTHEYTNRAYAYLCLRDYTAAAHDFATVMAFDPDVDAGYVGYGVCQWCQKQPEEAIAYWKKALDAAYTDAAGGVEVVATLLYAGLRTHQPAMQKRALQLLRQLDRTKRAAMNWPGPIAGLLLGQISWDELHDALLALPMSPLLVERYLCQAHFHRAVRSLLDDEAQVFEQEMRACSHSWNGYLAFEYYLATWEVDQQFPDIASIQSD
jgi:tetratricopeptide (TPR) repeat protein